MREIVYNRNKAVEYAHKWAFSRNPAYYDFQNLGGDCTNFASQCIFAGSGIMNYTPVHGWYYRSANDRTPSWTGVNYLYDFLTNNRGVGPYAEVVTIDRAQPGDLAQLSFSGDLYQHSPVIVSVGSRPSPDNILVSSHTFNSDNRLLSTYSYNKIRFVHIIGARK